METPKKRYEKSFSELHIYEKLSEKSAFFEVNFLS